MTASACSSTTSRRSCRCWLSLTILVLTTGVAGTADAQAPEVYEYGRELTSLLLGDDIGELTTRLSPEFRSAIGGKAGLERLVDRLRRQAGEEREVAAERAYLEGRYISYYRVVAFDSVPSLTIRWVWDRSRTVVAANVSATPDPAATGVSDRQPSTALRLPVGTPSQGYWYVAWGGNDAIANYHVQAPDQRFAYDFVVVRGGFHHEGDGSRNEQHHCWEQPVVAPAAGFVVTAVDSVPDNTTVGTKNDSIPPGNHVIIQHAEREYSLIAHLQRGSIAVRPGQEVEKGEIVGRCGNSGRSSLPHVHYHLQDEPTYGQGTGLPAPFTGYFEGGKYIPRGVPVRGDLILPEGPRVQ